MIAAPAHHPVRRSDWQPALSAAIAQALQRPFEWGVHDCALFAADAVWAMTGTDLAEGWRGRYRTATAARRRLAGAGLADAGALAAAHLPEIALARADQGDIAAIWTEAGPALAVVTGPLLAAPGPRGLRFGDRTLMLRAFHVPHPGEAG